MSKLLLSVVTVLACLVIYSSTNAVLWGYFLDYIAQSHHGTVKNSDLSPWIQDLASAWSSDLIYSEIDPVTSSLVHFPLGITIFRDAFLPQGNLWMMIGLIAIVWAGAYAVPLVANRFSASTKHTGLSADFMHSQGIRQHLQRIQSRSTLLAFAFAPLITLGSWYITYDRVQSTWTNLAGNTRYAKYLSESFYPQTTEWVAIFTLLFMICGFLIVFRSNRFIKKIPAKDRIAHQQFCPNRRCRYEVSQEISICPECGLDWKRAVTEPEVPVKKNRIKRPGIAIGVLISLTIAVILIRSPNQRYFWHNWLTLRAERFTQQQLYLAPNRPIHLEWNNDQVWIAIVEIDPTNPDAGYRIVFKINDQLLDMFSNTDDESSFIEFNGAKVIKMEGQFYVSISPPATPYITIPILVRPDYVRGFPSGIPLSEEAQIFLGQAMRTP